MPTNRLPTTAAGVVLRPDRIVAGGAAIARGADGRVVFVEGALPGETVLAEVTLSKRDFSKARLVEVRTASPDRVTPPCRFVGAGCGGCGWQHIEPAAQADFKRLIVIDALRHTAGLRDADVFLGPALADQRFRTTLRLGVGRDGLVGFHASRSNDIVAVDDCLVAHSAITELLPVLRFVTESGADRVPGRAPQVTIRVGARSGERMLWWRHTNLDVSVELPSDVRIGEEASIVEVIDGHRLQVSAQSFFQSSPEAAEAIVDAVRDAAGEFLEMGNGPFIDLYGGIGLFAATMAPVDRPIVVVEASTSACADARVNLAGREASVVESRVEVWQAQPASLVVADPARAGLDKLGVGAVAATRCDRLVLVSCDAVSLARDARLLDAAGYRHRGSLVLDPFPHTPHIEVVSRFDRA